MSKQCMPFDCTEVLYFLWDPQENKFYNEYGLLIVNIFEFITPNDLFLFRHDHGNSIFQHRTDTHILCEILVDE